MSHKRVLKYLKKKGQTNTFRIARDLGIDRNKLLNILKKLEEKRLVELKFGTAKFLKFPEKVKKASKKLVEVKKAISAPKKAIRHKVRRVMAKRKPSVLYSLQAENKELRERLIELEKTIKVLQERASAPPKIIRRTIVKNIIKEVPIEKIQEKPKKFKLPRFSMAWIKNIQQLKIPEFLQRKINISKPKIFADLNKYVQQLHAPEMLRKGI